MVCMKIVREHSSDLMDAVAVGDDVDYFCRDEVKVAPPSITNRLRCRFSLPRGKSLQKLQ